MAARSSSSSVADGSGGWRSCGHAASLARARAQSVRACYPPRTVRLIEIRLLEGPNVYRLEPVVKLEVAIGRRRTWYGQRDPGRHALVRLGATVPARDWPDGVAAIVALGPAAARGPRRGPRRPARSIARPIPGHWIVTFPWVGAERALTLTEAALALAERDVSPSRTAPPDRRPGAPPRPLDRADRRRPDAPRPSWIRDADRRIPIVSITGHERQEHVTRLITHILRRGRAARRRRRPRTASSSTSGWSSRATGPDPAARSQILARDDIDVAVLETARGGIVLRGVGYESNDASVLTNVSSDHLDLQGIHTLPELAEVKSTICRITKPDGWVVLNADDPLRRGGRAPGPRARRAASRSRATRSARRPAPSRRGGRAYLVRDGWHRSRPRATTETADRRRRRACPITIGGLARHNVANALAAAGGARGAGRDDRAGSRRAAGPSPRRPSARRGRLNLFRDRSPGRDRRLRPQRGRRRGRARRRRGDRRRAPPAGRRRSPRSSGPPAIGPTTRSAGSAGSPPSGPSGSRSRRRSTTCAAGRASRSSASCWSGSSPAAACAAGRPDLRVRDGGAPGRAQRCGRRRCPRRPGGCGAGHRPDVPRGARRRLRPARERSARGRSTSPRADELVPRLQGRPGAAA